jgi:hypothetical protein
VNTIDIKAGLRAVKAGQNEYTLGTLLEGVGECSHDQGIVCTVPVWLAPLERWFDENLNESMRKAQALIEKNGLVLKKFELNLNLET